MVGDVEVMTDVVDEVMAMVADVGMIMAVVVTLVPWEQIIMVEDKELKWLTKVIMVERRSRHSTWSWIWLWSILSLTTWGAGTVYLFYLWTCQKGKGKGKCACAAPP
jgi:hypothetical protein